MQDQDVFRWMKRFGYLPGTFGTWCTAHTGASSVSGSSFEFRGQAPEELRFDSSGST
jgi:hypothetical protein